MDAHRGQQVLETLELLVDTAARGLAGLDAMALRRLSTRSTDVQSWLAAFDTQIASAAAALTVAGMPVDPEPVVSGGGRKSRREAAAAVERAKACTVVPGVGDALAAGDLGPAHVDAVAAATRTMSEQAKERFAEHATELVDNGRFDTPEEFARRCKQLAATVIDETERLARQERCRTQRRVTRWADSDGMCHTKLSLDPLTDAQVWATIEATLGITRNTDQTGDDRTFDQLRADVVVDLLTHPTATGDGVGDGGGRPGGIGAEVSVLVDLDTLLGRAGEAGMTLCETADGQPLPVATVRRLCCDGTILPIVLDGDGIPTDVGRAQRLATRAQRQALRAMYASCAHPQCTVGYERCRIHHVRFWEQLGPTDLANLLPVCERHHHLVHEGGWTLTIAADRIATWTTPDGRIVHHGDSRNRWTSPQRVESAAGGPSATSADATIGRDHRGEQARRMADEVTTRRRHASAAAATTMQTSHRWQHGTANDPIPLFGTDDTLRRRGPPHAS